MEELEQALARITVETPDPPQLEQTRSVEVPSSYTSNSKKEKVLLGYADNFQRQYRQLYGDRKALFITPPNEHGIEKFVCTTLRPTHLPYQQLYEYDGCASFVAGYLNFEPLNPPTKLPKRLCSPTHVLSQQSGNSFEYAVLLCSLLIGVGYDAYCVLGYASDQVCLMDQSRKTCPSLTTEQQDEDSETQGSTEDDVKHSKYTVRPPRDLSSRFIKRQQQKEQDKKEAEERKKKEEEAARIAEQERPPDDPLHGLRIHCWVLVLAGKREVAESFFVEPTTGEPHPLDWDQYLGIETLWNHRNYWVNMQDCAHGIQNMVYDLGDATKWEYFFPNVEKPLLVLPGEEEKEFEDKEEEEEEEQMNVVFELPPSWVLPISLSPRDLETHYPRGGKTLLYHKSKLEQFAEYLHNDGLVEKLTTFTDTSRTDKLLVKEQFSHRKDGLLTRVTHARTGQQVESFTPGQEGALKEHTFYGPKNIKSDCRTMLYYASARVDGLASRELTGTEMVEIFEDREDRLCYRKTVYGKPVKKFEPSSDRDRKRPVKSILEWFRRDPSVRANDDIAQRVFMIEDNRIKLTYHLEENRITPSTREFVTPPLSGDHAQPLTLTRDMTTAYQVDTYYKEPKDRHLFELLERLVSAQEESLSCVAAAEIETEQMLSRRMQEELNLVLTISVYDVVRNEDARRHRQELEERLAEEERIRKEKERDYLAPYLAHIGDPPQLSASQKDAVKQQCLEDLRTRLVEVANIIQTHFEKETEDLQQKQAWYKQNQHSLTKEKEAEYISYCSAAMFRIHILEYRLNRHKTVAPQKYRELERRLKTDPRLAGISLLI